MPPALSWRTGEEKRRCERRWHLRWHQLYALCFMDVACIRTWHRTSTDMMYVLVCSTNDNVAFGVLGVFLFPRKRSGRSKTNSFLLGHIFLLESSPSVVHKIRSLYAYLLQITQRVYIPAPTRLTLTYINFESGENDTLTPKSFKPCDSLLFQPFAKDNRSSCASVVRNPILRNNLCHVSQLGVKYCSNFKRFEFEFLVFRRVETSFLPPDEKHTCDERLSKLTSRENISKR